MGDMSGSRVAGENFTSWIIIESRSAILLKYIFYEQTLQWSLEASWQTLQSIMSVSSAILVGGKLNHW